MAEGMGNTNGEENGFKLSDTMERITGNRTTLL